MSHAASALFLALAVPACNQPAPPSATVVVLKASARAAAIVLPDRHGGKIIVEVTRVLNPRQHAATLAVRVAGQEEPLTRFALYPPDRPARIAMRVPVDAKSLIVELEGRPGKIPELIELRAVAFPK